MFMNCPNCHTRVPVLLEPAAPAPGTRVAEHPREVVDTTEQLQTAIREFNGSRVVRLVRPPTPSEAAHAPKRPLTTIAGELRQALEEEAKADELSREADRAQRTAAHYRVDAMRRVVRLRHELQQTAEGKRC